VTEELFTTEGTESTEEEGKSRSLALLGMTVVILGGENEFRHRGHGEEKRVEE
jgi:hypothetical protein